MTGRPVYIVDGSRTPFIRARGRPGPFTPVDLTVACGKPLLLRQPFAPEELAPRHAADVIPLQRSERERHARAAPTPLVGEGWGGR